jgi:hypothetical protein
MRPLLAALFVMLSVVGLGQMKLAQPTQADKARLASLEKSYKVAKADYVKKPKDAGVRKKFVMAATKFGHESMTSPVLPAKVKYRQALRIYREVLAIDPKNPVAKPESDLIVRIYKSMGREVPKD